jgi:predicted ATPase/DNA-binding CsgD family transcriptional regulator
LRYNEGTGVVSGEKRMNHNPPVRDSDSLTGREQEILTLIQDGLSNYAIAEELVLSYHTVTWYVKQIFSKLGVNRRTQAVAVARSLGILEDEAWDVFQYRRKHNLPSAATSFVGREEETAQIIALLNDTDCRLVTLVGPGGIGKTRLALEVVARQLDEFTDGVFFVALQPLTSHEEIVPTIANTLEIKLQSNITSPHQPVFDFFREKSVLLLLDNFEHVLEGVQIVPDLLASAPDVKILITSRESLNLLEEYLFDVGGLPFPSHGTEGCTRSRDSFQAVKLFADRADQICPNFSLVGTLPDVVDICRLVEGMPLAIELAASWLKTLSCQEIAKEIQQGLDVLATTMRNVPERHRSISATFNVSWKSLNHAERKVFGRLSVFRGGCTPEAARTVAGANRWTLRSLTDKSFIRRDVTRGRYDFHELLRQFGEHELEKSAGDVESCHARHGAFFAELLARHRDNIVSSRQLEMMRELEPELDNIRKAWRWAVDHSQIDDILKSVHTLAYFHVFRGRFLEEAEAFEKAVHRLDSKAPDRSRLLAMAVLLSYLGWIYIRIGEYERTEASFQRSRLLYQLAHEAPPVGLGTEPLTGLAMLACIQGEYDEAVRLGEEVCRVSEERKDPLNRALGLYAIMSAYFHQGRYEAARELAELWLIESRESGGLWNLADPLNSMGNISRVMGKYAQAMNYYQESYEIRQTFNDPQGMAAARNFMGMTAVLAGDTVAARRHYLESYELYNESGDRGGVGYALCGLGSTAFADGDHDEAYRQFYRALKIVSSINYVPVTFLALIGIGELLIASGQPARGVGILTLVHEDEHCGHEAKEKVSCILDRVPSDIVLKTDQDTNEHGAKPNLEQLVQRLLDAGSETLHETA